MAIVPIPRVQLGHPFGYQHLKPARLPISPDGALQRWDLNTRICTIEVFSSRETTTGRVGTTLPDENNTYYTGTARRETDYRVTTYSFQRPKESAVTYTRYATAARDITESCYRVDNANQPNETVTQIDNSICEFRISNYSLP